MKKVLFAVLAVSLLVVAGCVKTVPVTVKNGLGDWKITAVYMYPVTQVSRGENMITADLVPDSTAALRVLPGNYNILVIDEDNDCYTYNNVSITSDGYNLEVKLDDLNSSNYNVGTGHYPLTVTNGLADYDIWYVYVDPVGTEPTTEYMGSGILFTDETITIWLEPGTYVVKAVDDSDASFTYDSVQVTESGAKLTVNEADIDTPRPAEEPASVTVVNGLAKTVSYLYIDKSDEPWGDDRLGASVLAPGDTFVVDITTGTWGMKAQDEDGNTYTLWGQDITPEGYTWTVTADQMD